MNLGRELKESGIRRILRSVDLVLLVLLALAAIGVSFLHHIGLLEQIHLDYALVTMLLLSVVALHLIVSHFLTEDYRNDTTDLMNTIRKGINSTDVRIFVDAAEIERYLGNRILQARRSVRDMSWKAKISEGFSAADRQVAHSYMDKCITKASDRITYREIFMFNDARRVVKLNRRLAENKKGYSCRYFKESSSIPRIQFVIVDDEEVFFFASAPDSLLCSFRNSQLCHVFRSYYEALWSTAIPIKDGPNVDQEQVAYIRNTSKYSGSGPATA